MSETPVHPTGSGRRGRVAGWFVGVSATLSTAIGVGSVFGFITYLQASDVGAGVILELPSDGSDPAGEEPPTGPCVDDVCNYLLLGSDSRSGLSPEQEEQFASDKQIGGENRADTIMLVHTDPRLQKAIILSFPRDLYVEIPGHGEDKINAAFEGGINGGGAALVASTIHRLTGLKINHVLYVDLAGFQGVVDTLGGVDMCIPPENVNTPGYVETQELDGSVGQTYYEESGHIVDMRAGLDVRPGCQRLPADQALAYVRARHLKCDQAAPDFYRIARQQQFLGAVINKILQPDQLARLPLMIKPILSNMRRDDGLKIADLAFLTGQLEGITSGAVEFRTVPAFPDPANLGILRLDPAATKMFDAIRRGEQLGVIGADPVYTPPTEPNVPVLVVDHASGGGAAEVSEVLSQAGFDISPGMTSYDVYGSKVPGNVIAYDADAEAEAQVVAKYFPELALKRVKRLPDDVAVFVTAGYETTPLDTSGSADADCPSIND
jgi:LCP family protein required for cell wall assembly